MPGLAVRMNVSVSTDLAPWFGGLVRVQVGSNGAAKLTDLLGFFFSEMNGAIRGGHGGMIGKLLLYH